MEHHDAREALKALFSGYVAQAICGTIDEAGGFFADLAGAEAFKHMVGYFTTFVVKGADAARQHSHTQAYLDTLKRPAFLNTRKEGIVNDLLRFVCLFVFFFFFTFFFFTFFFFSFLKGMVSSA